MNINEVIQRLHFSDNIPAGTNFLTTIEGHLILVNVIKNRADMIASENVKVEPEIPDPVIQGLSESVSNDEPQQFVEEPLDVRGENEVQPEPNADGGGNVPDVQPVEGKE